MFASRSDGKLCFFFLMPDRSAVFRLRHHTLAQFVLREDESLSVLSREQLQKRFKKKHIDSVRNIKLVLFGK